MLAKILANNCVQVALLHTNDLKRQVFKLAPWGLPLVVGGAWFVYPALTKEFKSKISPF